MCAYYAFKYIKGTSLILAMLSNGNTTHLLACTLSMLFQLAGIRLALSSVIVPYFIYHTQVKVKWTFLLKQFSVFSFDNQTKDKILGAVEAEKDVAK